MIGKNFFKSPWQGSYFYRRFVQVIERVSQSIWKERLRVRSCQVMLLKPFMSQRGNANAAEVQEKLPAGRERCY